MKLAIHHRAGSYSDRWIKYCEANQVAYKIVNCYSSDIVTQLADCKGLMWHWNQNDYKASLFARQLTTSLEKKGIRVFPDVNTSWHHDDKVGQKYLLEALGAPLVKSYVFYTRQDAMEWLNNTTFPKVFKLRNGAGSLNVSLVKTKKRAEWLVKKAFGKGFSHINRVFRLKDRLRAMKRDTNMQSIKGVLSGFARMFIPTEVEQFSHNEKGYIYFQDFIPDNNYDTRLIVIGDRCFGGRRYCRKGDFRASGSGLSSYDPDLLDKNCIRSAFEIADKVKSQSVAFDFILDNQAPKIVEMSYCFPLGPVSDNCQGYWDSSLKWHDKKINPQFFMIEDFVAALTGSKNEEYSLSSFTIVK